jgi:hypothetical protein
MEGSNEQVRQIGNTKRFEATLELARALVVVRDAGYAMRGPNLVMEDPGHRRRQDLGLAAPGSRERHTVTCCLKGIELLRIAL